MAEKKTTEKPSTTSGSELERETDPNDPSHKDAGQQHVDENDPDYGKRVTEKRSE